MGALWALPVWGVDGGGEHIPRRGYMTEGQPGEEVA